MNNRGQGLSTSTIILIILGVIVLVMLALGFTIGWNRFLPFVSSNNIDNIKTACSTACSTQNTYDYCSLQRTVNDGVNKAFKETCSNLAAGTITSPPAGYVAPNPANYGIDACSTITC